MGRFTRWLTGYNPLQGRRITEDGGFYNEADHFKDNALSELSLTSLRGTLFRTFNTVQLANGQTDTYILNIPAGVTVYGFARFVTVKEGDLKVQYLSGGTKGAVEATFTPRNFDQRDIQPNKLSLTKLEKVASVTGATPESPEKEVVSPSTTSVRVPSTQTEAGGVVPLDDSVLPVFTVENTGKAGTTYTIELYFSEVVNES